MERYPKLQSPYHRAHEETVEGEQFLVQPDVKSKFSWVFDQAEDVRAVEKLNGENMVLQTDGSEPSEIYARTGEGMERVDPLEPDHKYLVRAVQNARQRGYLDDLTHGYHYGEALGPTLGGGRHAEPNPHELDEHVFFPFEWIEEHCTYESYGEYPTSFEAISDWFEDGLFSLFACAMDHELTYEEARPSNGTYVEGLVFYHPDFEHGIPFETGIEESYKPPVAKNVVKLRRDMFPWYYE